MSNQPIDKNVQLGCGSLILIAIIVMVFSGDSDSKKLQRDLNEMKGLIHQLNEKFDTLSKAMSGSREGGPPPPAGLDESKR